MGGQGGACHCSPGHAGKEGPQLARTGASQGLPRAAAPVGVSHEVRRGVQVASRVATGKSGLHGRGKGKMSLLILERAIFLRKKEC